MLSKIFLQTNFNKHIVWALGFMIFTQAICSVMVTDFELKMIIFFRYWGYLQFYGIVTSAPVRRETWEGNICLIGLVLFLFSQNQKVCVQKKKENLFSFIWHNKFLMLLVRIRYKKLNTISLEVFHRYCLFIFRFGSIDAVSVSYSNNKKRYIYI